MTWSRCAFVVWAVLLLPGTVAGAGPGDTDLGLKIPDGFRVTVVADETLANDTYAMTLDARGRVVVTTRGSVSTLVDTDGDGRADRADLFATTQTGGMGLCFDGNDLLFCGDGWLSRYRDADGDGRADGPPERLLPLVFTEHGGHAMRKGPDGFWYVIGGNDSGIGPGHATLPGSPVVAPEAGGLLRLTPDGKRSEILAHGFRNPYDFDFNASGDLFTYDSDVERDVFLPWYAPTRLFHLATGGHHGWRLTGYQRSWPRPGDDPGTVEILAPVGRGSPTGVVCYRHRQFPSRFRDGLFVLDWTFGKVYFVTLQPLGASYRATLEIFLEPTGTSGFAPTDAVVAPDGSLLVSIGGRKTRGSVYKIEYVGPRVEPEPGTPRDDVDTVLRSPQPLDAWSRARWVPLAKQLGREKFLQAATQKDRPDDERVRAVEIVTELFGGLDPAQARSLAGEGPDAVRRRVAWSLGRARGGESVDVLATLSDDPDPRTRLAALDAWTEETWKLLTAAAQSKLLLAGLGHTDRRVRQSSGRLAARSPEPTWGVLVGALPESKPQAKLSGLLAEILRHPEQSIHDSVASRLCDVLGETSEAALRFQGVRLLQRALGDYHLKNPAVEVETAYSLQPSLAGHERLSARVAKGVRPCFPSGDERLDDESGRLLAMLEVDDAGLPEKVAAFWGDRSSATRDLHFLIVLARFRASRNPDVTARTARAVVALDKKLDGGEQRIKQSWSARLGETVGLLLARDPALGKALLDEPGFVSSNHVALALALSPADRELAARRYLAAVKSGDDYVWSGPLIELLGGLPASEVRGVLRKQWDNFALRDALLPRLTTPPEESDRGVYLGALDSPQPGSVRTALGALESLPRDPSPEHLVAPLRLLRRLTLEPREGELRRRIVALLARQIGVTWDLKESATDAVSLRRLYQPVFDQFQNDNPQLAAKLLEGATDLAGWVRRFKQVDWAVGSADRGEKVFQERGCQTCHAGPRALGPDLTGITDRLSRDDLFTAIVAPSLDVSPLYRMTLVETHAGQVFSGMVAFESADGLILQTGATTTVRVANPDIASRQVGMRSLMPDQLLQGVDDRGLADLYQYLRTLSPRSGVKK